jgi:outer membrane lipase/esterase
MRQTNFALALLAAAALTACGGSDNNTAAAPAKPVFAAQISFGDSLSDVGTYQVGTVAALGGGKYTINGNNTAINPALHGKNWTELMAAQMGLAAPCAAVTGLQGVAAQGFAVPVVDHPTCFGYAEGGSRVTNPVGPGNAATGSPLGQLTIPVATQIATHLTRTGGTFKSTDVVYVLAGGNDAFMLLGGLTAAATAAGNTAGAQKFASSLTLRLAAGATNPTAAATAIGTAIAAASAAPGATPTTIVGAAVQAAATQPGNSAVASPAVYGPMVAASQADATAAGTAAGTAYGAANGPALVPQMGDAGTALAKLVKEQIVAKGATHVVLINLPDLVSAPSGASQSASSKQLIAGMVSAFNIALRLGIDGIEDKVLFVDAYTASVDEVVNPAKYGISNATAVACGPNALGTTSLVCKASNTLPGVDVSHYLFADDVHPAPYGQTLLAKMVADAMVSRGWL